MDERLKYIILAITSLDKTIVGLYLVLVEYQRHQEGKILGMEEKDLKEKILISKKDNIIRDTTSSNQETPFDKVDILKMPADISVSTNIFKILAKIYLYFTYIRVIHTHPYICSIKTDIDMYRSIQV